MHLSNSADSVVVKLQNGTLAIRQVSTLSEYQILSISNDTIYLSNGGFVKLPADNVNDADSNPANEIQDLSLTTNTLSLTGDATTVDLSGYLDNTDTQLSDEQVQDKAGAMA